MSSPVSPHLKRERGSVYLVGDDIDFVGNLVASEARSERLDENSIGYAFPPKYVSNRDKRDGAHRHMTLLSRRDIAHLVNNYRFGGESTPAFRAMIESDGPLEIQNNEKDAKPTNKMLEKLWGYCSERVLGFCQSFLRDRTARGKDWFVLGIGRQTEKSIERGNNETFFLVCSYPRAAALRRKLGLRPKDFHITLGFDQRDIHDCSKGVDRLLFNRSQSLEVTMNQIVSTPTELVEAARITILGGHPNDKMKESTEIDSTINIQKGRFHDANILLDAAEGMILLEKIQGQPISCHNTLTLLSLLGDSHFELTPFLEILEMRCQMLGRKQDFGNVVKHANAWIDLLETMQSSEDSTITTDLMSIALGYKGVALSMRKEWSKALPCLRTSYELYHEAKRRNGKPRDGVQTRLESQREREAVSIERMLAKCCKITGWEAPMPPLIAFPRTAHLFNTGGTAVSSDDCVLSKKSSTFRDFGNGVTVVAEEKIDGANLGFSLSATGEILAQNRSHFVTEADHPQFGVLTSWIHEHRTSLVKILSSPTDFQQRAVSQGLILYGEWCVARHSIQYDKLPGYFIAFDLYDRLEQKFFSRKRFNQVLHKSGIPYAPVIATKRFGPYPDSALRNKKATPFESDLRELLDTESVFATDGGLVEGVVLRIDDEDSKWLVNRVKIVRPDFANGIQDHWTRQEMQKQTVDWEFAQEYCSSNDEYCENYRLSSLDDEPVCLRERIINPRQQMAVSNGTKDDVVILPRNFSFLWKGEVALSSTPTSADQIQAWKDHFRTSLVVTLTEEEPLPQSWFQNVNVCRNLFVPVPNYHAPSKDQMDEIVQAIEETIQGGGSAVVHCGGGKGRAGTVGACLLVRYGSLGIRASTAPATGPSSIENIPTHFNSSAAIAFLRTIRPGSIETKNQESFVRQYSDLLWKRVILPDFGVLPDKPCHPSVIKSGEKNSSKLLLPAPNDNRPKPTNSNRPTQADPKQIKTDNERKLVQKAQRKAPRCILCMGLPGSGKSTFANRLAASVPPEHSWLVLNQDQLGKKECERLAGKGRSRRIILDRCNLTASERTRWLELLHAPPKGELALVYFSADAMTCLRRVQERTDHATIQGHGRRIVAEMQARLEPPTPLERKRYGAVHVVHTFHDAEAVLRSLGARA